MARITEAEYSALMARRGLKADVVICGPCLRNEHRKCLRRATPPQRCDCERHAAKYKNEPTVIDGIRFQSKREAHHWLLLQAEKKAGRISKLRRQVRFALVINRMLICEYVADMVYVRDGQEIVLDVKGRRTEVYRLKRKLMLAILGIEVVEV